MDAINRALDEMPKDQKRYAPLLKEASEQYSAEE